MKRDILTMMVVLAGWMAHGQQVITNVFTGTTWNDRTGDPLPLAFQKINTNFALVSTKLAEGSNNTAAAIQAATAGLLATNHVWTGSNYFSAGIKTGTNSTLSFGGRGAYFGDDNGFTGIGGADYLDFSGLSGIRMHSGPLGWYDAPAFQIYNRDMYFDGRVGYFIKFRGNAADVHILIDSYGVTTFSTNVNIGGAVKTTSGTTNSPSPTELVTQWWLTNQLASATGGLWSATTPLTNGYASLSQVQSATNLAFLNDTNYANIVSNLIWGVMNDRVVGATNNTVLSANSVTGGYKSQILGFNLTPGLNTTTRDHSIASGPTGGGTTEAVYSIPSLAGTLTNLYVRLYNIGANTNVTFTVMVNGSASALTKSLIGTAGVVNGSDTTHGAAVTAGQTLSMRIAGNNTSASAANIAVSWSVEFIR